jgi:ATP-binding cassette subfamily F protein 3
LNEYPGAVLLISHDPHLIETCADRLWLVANGRVTPFEGDMEDYRRILLDERKPAGGKAAAQAAKASRAEERKLAAERRAQLAPIKRKADDAERRIAKLQAECARLDAILHDPDLYANDAAKVTALNRQRADAQRQLETAETEWLEASDAHDRAMKALGEAPERH